MENQMKNQMENKEKKALSIEIAKDQTTTFTPSEKIYNGSYTGERDSATWKSAKGAIKMMEMTEEHLQAAFETVCYKEINLHNQMTKEMIMKDRLFKEAEARGLRLFYPDETTGKSFGNFFLCDRTLRKLMQVSIERNKHDKEKMDKSLREFKKQNR